MPSPSDLEEKTAFVDRRNRRRLFKNRLFDFAHRSVVYFLAGTTAVVGLALLVDMGYFSIYRYPAIRRDQKLHEKYLLESEEDEKKN